MFGVPFSSAESLADSLRKCGEKPVFAKTPHGTYKFVVDHVTEDHDEVVMVLQEVKD